MVPPWKRSDFNFLYNTDRYSLKSHVRILKFHNCSFRNDLFYAHTIIARMISDRLSVNTTRLTNLINDHEGGWKMYVRTGHCSHLKKKSE